MPGAAGVWFGDRAGYVLATGSQAHNPGVGPPPPGHVHGGGREYADGGAGDGAGL